MNKIVNILTRKDNKQVITEVPIILKFIERHKLNLKDFTHYELIQTHMQTLHSLENNLKNKLSQAEGIIIDE